MRQLLAVVLAVGLAVPGGTALGHHGWSWTTGENIELTGVIQSARLGNPHGELEVAADDEVWTVEVGQPWRNERAGLGPGHLAKGIEIRAIGEPSGERSEKRMKAERLVIGGEEYVLYPPRD